MSTTEAVTTITVTASVNRIGATTRKVLEEVGKEQDIPEFNVTSTQRPPRTQAQAMYDNISNGRDIRYKWAGEQVCIICRKMLSEKCTEKDTVDAMTKKIEELAEQGHRVSLHCVSNERYDIINVIDVSYKNLGDKAISVIKAFVERPEVTKIIQPLVRDIEVFDENEPAIHLEIMQ